MVKPPIGHIFKDSEAIKVLNNYRQEKFPESVENTIEKSKERQIESSVKVILTKPIDNEVAKINEVKAIESCYQSRSTSKLDELQSQSKIERSSKI